MVYNPLSMVIKGHVMNKNLVRIYTDGSRMPKPNVGGLGIYLEYNEDKFYYYGGKIIADSLEMEMLGVINALNILKEKNLLNGETTLIFYTDVASIAHQIKKYKKTKNNNVKIFKNKRNHWENILSLVKDVDINFRWVKGHDKTMGNIIADKLAEKGRKKAILNRSFILEVKEDDNYLEEINIHDKDYEQEIQLLIKEKSL